MRRIPSHCGARLSTVMGHSSSLLCCWMLEVIPQLYHAVTGLAL